MNNEITQRFSFFIQFQLRGKAAGKFRPTRKFPSISYFSRARAANVWNFRMCWARLRKAVTFHHLFAWYLEISESLGSWGSWSIDGIVNWLLHDG